MAEEYKPMGISMTNLTIGYGGLLIAWGIAVSLLSGSKSITSFIPAPVSYTHLTLPTILRV